VRLAEAVLEMAITYRKLIMPLVSATERRLDMDKSVRDEVERVAKQLESIKRRGPAASGSGDAER